MKIILKLRMKLFKLLRSVASMFLYIGKFLTGLWKIILAYLHKLQMLNMYVDCYSLNVGRYIDIISLNDYKKYKRTFIPVGVSCYKEASEKVSAHVIELSKNTKIKALNSLSGEIERLKDKHCNLYLIGQILEFKESEICLNKLKEMGYNASSRETGLKSVVGALKNIYINIQLLEKQYDEKKEDNTSRKATTKAEFMSQKLILHKEGYGITEKSSTADYITAIGLVGDEIKRMETIKNK